MSIHTAISMKYVYCIIQNSGIPGALFINQKVLYCNNNAFYVHDDMSMAVHMHVQYHIAGKFGANNVW